MPAPLSSVVIEEKNKLFTDSVWLLALEITIPGVGTPVRVVRNNENITWRTYTWVAFPFEVDEYGEESKGEVPQFSIRVSNISQAMELYVADYDLYCKTNGYSPITVSIFALNSEDLANDTPAGELFFELKKPKLDSKWATFVLGAANPFSKRFPQHRILKGHCRFIFKGTLCGYTGGESVCNKTLPRCRELLNQTNFGGFPGAGYGGIRIA